MNEPVSAQPQAGADPHPRFLLLAGGPRQAVRRTAFCDPAVARGRFGELFAYREDRGVLTHE